MGEYKRQHFVPKFYLKNFAIDEVKKSIALYNHRIAQYVPRATIKGQAYDNYLYGKDGSIEKELQSFEDAVAILLANPITKINPPDNPKDFNLLREYMLVQHFRTKKAGNEILDSLNAGIKAINPFMPSDQQLPPEGTLSHDFPSLLSLYNALEYLPLTNYLVMRSFVNLTQYPFITSDHPVIVYNQWMESKGSYMGATGLAVKGLQMFLPIHPRLMYCLYDPYIYDFAQKNSGTVAIESEEIILQLNQLQYLFSDEHLYFDGTLTEQYFKELTEANKHLRRPSTAISMVIPSVSSKERWQFFHSSVDPHNNLQLPFFTYTEHSKIIDLKDGLPLLRHPSFEKLRKKSLS
jgi:hypothetical protein